MMKLTMERLLAPMSIEQFFDEYYERQPLVLRRQDRSFYDPYLNLEDLDFLVSTLGKKSAGLIRLASGNRPPKAVPITRDGWLSLPNLFEAYQEGHTLILEDIQRRLPSMAYLCQSFAQVFNDRGTPVLDGFTLVLFLTPPDSQALQPHYDPSDLFIMQLSGAKHWKLYGPGDELPMRRQKLAGESAYAYDELPAPTHDLILQPGDLLYFPRGWIHEAKAADTHSFHLTFGIDGPLTWFHLVEKLAGEIGALRHTVPMGVLADHRLSAQGKHQMRELLLSLLQDAQWETYFDRVFINPMAKGQAPRNRGFQALNQASRVNVDTLLRRRFEAGPIQYLGLQVRMPFEDDFILSPLRAVEALEFVRGANRPFRASEIPGPLSSASVLTLMKRLISQGLIEIVTES